MMAVVERESMSAERRGDVTDWLTTLIDPRGKMSRPRVRDGGAPSFEEAFRRMSELKGPHDGSFDH